MYNISLFVLYTHTRLFVSLRRTENACIAAHLSSSHSTRSLNNNLNYLLTGGAVRSTLVCRTHFRRHVVTLKPGDTTHWFVGLGVGNKG